MRSWLELLYLGREKVAEAARGAEKARRSADGTGGSRERVVVGALRRMSLRIERADAAPLSPPGGLPRIRRFRAVPLPAR